MTDQRDAFLAGEGDAWFSRNAGVLDGADSPPLWLEDIAPLVGPEDRVLEIGCANGRNLAGLRNLTGCSGSGVDPSAAAIADGLDRFDGLDLRVGTADSIEFREPFDFVIVGFCLYLVDRSLLSRSVAETDRCVASPGYLAIVDFDPPQPRRRRYHHLDGLFSFKLDYSAVFDAFPHFSLVSKRSLSHAAPCFSPEESERVSATVLYKDLDSGYGLEDPT